MRSDDVEALRAAIRAFPADVSADAHGAQAPTRDELYAPAAHGTALDVGSPIVLGSRGAGKSFWSGVLGDAELRAEAAKAYPQLGLERVEVTFGFTGLPGPRGMDRDKVDAALGPTPTESDARNFWWATILGAIARAEGQQSPGPSLAQTARDVFARERWLEDAAKRLEARDRVLLIVFDALDAVATDWARRRLLTEALLEVVWALRAWRTLRPKLFIRPDQLEDDQLHFVELPKLKTGAVRLSWRRADLYALLFARLAVGPAGDAFHRLLGDVGVRAADRAEILARRWELADDEAAQRKVFSSLAGEFMGSGPNAHKKGRTYDWLPKHLGDAFGEVSPRSFLGLIIGASQHHVRAEGRLFTPEGIQHGLRRASTTRVDQLHLEFRWIKGALAPLAGLLLPREQAGLFAAWRKAKTVELTLADARQHGYLLPTSDLEIARERGLLEAMQSIGVVLRRSDQRIDMPDLFRVAAKLVKKGATAPG